MRKAKILSMLALGLVPLLLAVTLLPAGAETAVMDNDEDRSQELVVCETDSSGIVQKIRVFDTLGVMETGSGGEVEIKEEYLYGSDEPDSITGVTSFNKPELDGDYLVWKGIDTSTDTNTIADIHFSKAMVDEAKTRIPLKVTYQYYFDGKLVGGPEDILGKTGRFRLEATFVNTSGEMMPVPYEDPDTGETLYQNAEVYLPLVIQPYDWKFDNQCFFNLETDPMAVIIPKPDVTQPGWTIPLFPPATEAKQTIWVEADVKDFRMPALALVIAFKFPSTNQANPLDTLGPGLEDLYGGIKQLDSGLSEAVAGLGSAATPDTLIYGIGQIYNGLLMLASNTEGLGYAKANIDSGLIPGVNQLYGGADLVIGGLTELKSKIGTPGEAGTLEWAVNQVMLGISTGDPLNPGLKEGLQGIIAALNEPFNPVTFEGGLIGAMQFIRSMLGPIGTSGTLLYQVDGLIKNFTLLIPPAMLPPYGSMYYYVNVTAQPPSVDPLISPAATTALNNQMAGMAGQLNTALPMLQALYDGMGDGSDPDTIIGGLFYMSAVLNSMVNGIGTTVDPGTLLNGLNQIVMGLDLMKAGIGDTANQTSLIGGVNQIKYGLASGSTANPGIKEGLTLVSSGLGTAIAGLGSAGTPDTLIYGANLIEGGLVELQGGLTQATDEGTKVMITGLDGSLKTINLTNAELKALQARAAEFDAFLGKPLDGDSMMRFIYQTPAVYSYKDGGGSSHTVAIVLSIVIALGLVLAGIFLFRKLA